MMGIAHNSAGQASARMTRMAMVILIGVISCRRDQLKEKATTEVSMIAEAVLGFHSVYGYMPIPNGIDEPAIDDVMPILLMDSESRFAKELNHRGIRFLDVAVDRMQEGEFLDPWGTPYQIRFPDVGFDFVKIDGTIIDAPVAVWSVGRNRKDEAGRGDDIASWR